MMSRPLLQLALDHTNLQAPNTMSHCYKKALISLRQGRFSA